MIRTVRTYLHDTPLHSGTVLRRVIVCGVVADTDIDAAAVHSEMRSIAQTVLAAEPADEHTELISQHGASIRNSNVRHRDVEIGTILEFEIDGSTVPIRMRDAPLDGEVLFVVSLSATVEVPEIFEISTTARG